jgi:hypothetical protein
LIDSTQQTKHLEASPAVASNDERRRKQDQENALTKLGAKALLTGSVEVNYSVTKKSNL